MNKDEAFASAKWAANLDKVAMFVYEYDGEWHSQGHPPNLPFFTVHSDAYLEMQKNK